MRIGIDASRANLEQRTGTEWYAFHLIRALAPLFKPEDRIRLYVKEPLRVEWGPLPSNVQVRVLGWWPTFLWTQLRLSWEIVFHPVDVLFVPAHTIPFLSPRRTLTTLHDIGFEHAQELYGHEAIGKRKWTKRLLNLGVQVLTFGHYGASELDYHRFSARRAIASCPKIITISEYSKEDICTTYGVDPERIIIIPNAHDAILFNASVRERKAEITEAKVRAGVTAPYLMTISRIEKKKNSLGLVRAFALLVSQPAYAHLQLLLVGKPGLGYEAITQFIETNGLTAKVLFPGWTSERDVPLLMAGAEAFILPSFFEGFGIPVIEAMAVGTPVLCSNTTALPEVVGGAAELFDPTSPEAIVEACTAVLGNPNHQEELRTRGMERASEFSWARSAALLIPYFYQL